MLQLRSVFTWVVVLGLSALLGSLLAPLIILSLGRLREPLMDIFQPLWGRVAAACAGVEVRVTGQEHLQGRKPRVLAANHSSTLDLVAWTVANAPNPLPVVKRELMWLPPLNLLFWLMGGVFLARGKTKGVDALKQVAARVRDGEHSIQMSVEGTRSPDGRLLPFKKGPFHVAYQSGADLIPVVIQGTHALCPKGSWWIRPGLVTVDIQPPARLTGDATADSVALRADFLRWMGQTD